MYIIEPCCAPRHLMGLRRALGSGGTVPFEGYGDLSLTELLPALLTRYSETTLVIAAPAIPEQAAAVIGKWMAKQWARMDGRGRLDAVSRLVVVTSLESSPDVRRWMDDGAFGGRLTVTDREQADTVILLPDLAVTGPVNMRYGGHFTAEATNDPERLAALRQEYMPKEETPGEETPVETETPIETETPVLEEAIEEMGAESSPAAARNNKGRDRKRRKDAEQ